MSESKETAVAVTPSVEIVKKNEEGGAYCEDCDTNTVYEKDGKMSCFQCGAQMESSSLVNTTEFNADGQVCFFVILYAHIYILHSKMIKNTRQWDNTSVQCQIERSEVDQERVNEIAERQPCVTVRE